MLEAAQCHHACCCVADGAQQHAYAQEWGSGKAWHAGLLKTVPSMCHVSDHHDMGTTASATVCNVVPWPSGLDM
jgi:hypothetical protein